MKRASYLAQLTAAVSDKPTLRPPPRLFRAGARDALERELGTPAPPTRITSDRDRSRQDSTPPRQAMGVIAPSAAARAAVPPTQTPAAAPAPKIAPREAIAPAKIPTETLQDSAPLRSDIPREAARLATPRELPAQQGTVEPATDHETRDLPTRLLPKPSIERTARGRSTPRSEKLSINEASVRIGTVEVHITPPPTTPAPATVPRTAAPSRQQSLARGFRGFGLVQG
jgi:hypothetical protein